MKIIQEFKDFAVKGNVIDLAVGVIIGASFGKIVTSLVNDILMPPIGALIGGVDFSEKVFKVSDSVVINYGIFINNVIDFLIVAVVIFFVIKQMNKLKKQEERREELNPSVGGPTEAELLVEIRDLLKK